MRAWLLAPPKVGMSLEGSAQELSRPESVEPVFLIFS